MAGMHDDLTLSFIGGGNMARALGGGLIGKRCAASNVHIIDPAPEAQQHWQPMGCSVAAAPDASLSGRRIWVFAVKPQVMKSVVAACQPFLQPDTLVISIAAGITASTLAQWLGHEGQPFTNIVRAMPNTPALVARGATGLLALDGVSEADLAIATQMFKIVGQVVQVATDAQLDAVTALSGSGPAYVFLFIESLINGAQALGLSAEQARNLALATLSGATDLATLSPESPATLRERVTSAGGTTAAALAVMQQHQFSDIIQQAMLAARDRAVEMAIELAN